MGLLQDTQLLFTLTLRCQIISLPEGPPTSLEQLPPRVAERWELPPLCDWMTIILSLCFHPSFLEQGNCPNKPTCSTKEVMYVIGLQALTQALAMKWPFPTVLHWSVCTPTSVDIKHGMPIKHQLRTMGRGLSFELLASTLPVGGWMSQTWMEVLAYGYDQHPLYKVPGYIIKRGQNMAKALCLN